MKNTFICIYLLITAISIRAQTVIDQHIPASQIRQLVVQNFRGSLDVATHQENTIIVKAELQDKAYSKEIKWQNKIENEFVLFYLESPCTKPKSEITFDPKKPLELSRWENNCEWDPQIEDPFPYLDYHIRVPEYIAVYLSTIMDGDINVTGASRKVHVQNVNGSITIDGAKNILQAKTVNGDIKTTFRDHPDVDGEFSTINGDIRMHMKTKPDLAITFKSFMGDFYTDMDELKVLPDRVIQKASDENKIILEEFTRMQIGNGTPKITFETMNGDVYLITNK